MVIGGLTLLALPGGNVIVLGGLGLAGAVMTGGEIVAAVQSGNDTDLAWAVAGGVLDLIDVTEIASLGFGTAAARAARRNGDEATAAIIESNPQIFDSLDSIVQAYPEHAAEISAALAKSVHPDLAIEEFGDDTLAAILHTSSKADTIAADMGISPSPVNHVLHGNKATGGHYRHSPNIRIIAEEESGGFTHATIEIFNPNTGRFKRKKYTSTLFPAEWSERQIIEEIHGAFEAGTPSLELVNRWEGVGPSGIRIDGFYSTDGQSWSSGWPTGDVS